MVFYANHSSPYILQGLGGLLRVGGAGYRDDVRPLAVLVLQTLFFNYRAQTS